MSTTQSTLDARDLLFVARGIQAARDGVLPMLHAALDEELRISTAPGEIDLAGLDAAGALTGQYGAIQSHLQDCIIRIMGGREDNLPALFARLERDAQAELDAALTLPTYRIHTEAYVSTHRVATEEEALDEFARDALTRIGMQDLIERIWRAQGFTALLVTHDVTEAVALADRILVVDEGRIALDLRVDVPRPRRRGDPDLARLEGRILDHLLGSQPTA
ncbi:hypothetical protein OMR07_08905 [Methylobacterium organophilum]|nr:hypothetical protein [Methylobacterium organophilum]